MHDTPPTITGFKILRLLGHGGMSEVWEAEHLRLGSRHAIKVFSYAKDDAEVRARFEQEGRMLATLRHPRIVAVSEIGRTGDGRPFFVMDLILNPEGRPQTLADIPDGAADEGTVARWYDDIREGLAYIHARGIIHRDLKFPNVMVGPDGHAVLTDFGISRVTAEGTGARAVPDPVDTLLQSRDGRRSLMGTVGYMAPELELGCEATPQSDWYALGVLVYRLLSGSWCDARTDLSGALGAFDPAWLQIVPKLLHANPAGRACPSFAETRENLREAEAAADERRDERRHARERATRRFAFGASALAALLAALLVFGAYGFRAERRIWQQRLAQRPAPTGAPLFDEIFAIPAAAKADDSTDADGNVIPSRSACAASRIDALILTRPLLADLARGRLTPEEAVARLDAWADDLQDDTGHSPLDTLEFGGVYYLQMGDNDSLGYLLRQAAERLRARSAE